MAKEQRRTGVTPGTFHGESFGWAQIIGNLRPGSSAFALPVFIDKFNVTTEDYFFGTREDGGMFARQINVYDPFYICCAFGPSEFSAADGHTDGDVILVQWSFYEKRYRPAFPFGLVRKAYLDEDLEPGASAAGRIASHTRDGADGPGFETEIYHWGDSESDTIPSGVPVQAWFESNVRRWYTSAYKAPPPEEEP